MLAAPESALAPGHRLPMKGSIMHLFLQPRPSPPERARPAPRKGKRVLGGSPVGLGPLPAGLPAAAMSGLSVEEGARAEREAPLRCRRALPAVRAGRAQAGPHAPRPRLARSVPAPRRRRRRPRRSRPFWAPRSALALNTQEMHNFTCEVEPFPLWSPGRRLAEASGARRRGEEAADGPGARGGRLPSDRLYLQPLSGAGREPAGGGAREQLPAQPRGPPRPTAASPWIPRSPSPLLTSASGSDTFAEVRRRPGEKPASSPTSGWGNKAWCKGLTCLTATSGSKGTSQGLQQGPPGQREVPISYSQMLLRSAFHLLGLFSLKRGLGP